MSILQAAAKQVRASEERVDVLVNNAAIIESFAIETHEMRASLRSLVLILESSL